MVHGSNQIIKPNLSICEKKLKICEIFVSHNVESSDITSDESFANNSAPSVPETIHSYNKTFSRSPLLACYYCTVLVRLAY